MIDKVDRLGPVKIKFKSFDKLDSKSIKLSRKIYNVLSKKMKALKLIHSDYPEDIDFYITLEKLMKKQGILFFLFQHI